LLHEVNGKHSLITVCLNMFTEKEILNHREMYSEMLCAMTGTCSWMVQCLQHYHIAVKVSCLTDVSACL